MQGTLSGKSGDNPFYDSRLFFNGEKIKYLEKMPIPFIPAMFVNVARVLHK